MMTAHAASSLERSARSHLVGLQRLLLRFGKRLNQFVDQFIDCSKGETL